jgi:hypothetical protein
MCANRRNIVRDRFVLALVSCLFLGFCLGCAQVYRPRAETLSAEDRIRACICTIIAEIAELKDQYPELATFSPTVLKSQIGPHPGCEWAMGFDYANNFKHATGKTEDKGPEFGKDGCYLEVDFRKIDRLDQRAENVLLPSSGVKVFWSCMLAMSESQYLKQAFDKIVKANLQKLKKNGT